VRSDLLLQVINPGAPLVQQTIWLHENQSIP